MQGKSNELVLAWIAGFMDGEGTFCLSRHSQRRFPYPQISVNNTHWPTLREFTDMLDQVGLPYYVARKSGAYTGPDGYKRKPQWSLQMFGFKRAERWCRALLPYLITKREDCELMLEYVHSRMTRNPPGTARWSPEKVGLSARDAEIANRLYGRHHRNTGKPLLLESS